MRWLLMQSAVIARQTTAPARAPSPWPDPLLPPGRELFFAPCQPDVEVLLERSSRPKLSPCGAQLTARRPRQEQPGMRRETQRMLKRARTT